MNLRFVALVTLAASLALTGCGKKAPSGQVLATVDGEEVTAIDLKNEMGGFTTNDPKVRKAAERQALQGIIARKWLAQQAKKQKIDKTPEFAQQKARAEEVLLVQTWQNKIVSMVPAPSADEVQKFVTDHPELYAEHAVFVTDQIRMPRNMPPAIVAQLGPAKTLGELEALLQANKVPYQKGRGALDALALGPEVTAQINSLPATSVFVLPAGNLLIANTLVNKAIQPLTPTQATQHATQYLKAQRTQQTVSRQMGGVMAGAKEKVKYAKGYEPPPAPKAPAKAPAGAAPAAPAAAAPAKPG